jgi:hypothetical protein
MSITPNIGKAAASGGLLIAACAACCAPLVGPWVVAAFAASGAGLALAGQVAIAILFAAAGGVYLWSRYRRQHASKLASPAANNCGCDSDAGCASPRLAITADTTNP